MDFETAVKLKIYETIAETAKAPTSLQVARALDATAEEVEAAFERLHQKRLLVPEPGDLSRIRMAPPFSGIETPFPVRARGNLYYANCAWDALGIPAALHEEAVIETKDANTGEPIRLEVKNGLPVPQACVIHFAVPAARWWEDIIIYLSDHAALPVGRVGEPVVRSAQRSQAPAREPGPVMAPGGDLVWEPADGGVLPPGPG